MEEFISFTLGGAGGFVSAMPIAGPTAVVVVTRGLQGHISSTRIVVAGAAVGESAYACLAFYGFSSYLSGYPSVLAFAKCLAATICIVLGLVFLLTVQKLDLTKKDDDSPRDVESARLDTRYSEHVIALQEASTMFCYGFGLTILNPALIITWAGGTTALFGSGLLRQDTGSWVCFGMGVCVGIQTWFNILLTLIQNFRHKIKDDSIHFVIKFFGVVLLCMGTMMVYRQVMELRPVRTFSPTQHV
jgi:threonine/homoserine/homoserine lactone efflux protein